MTRAATRIRSGAGCTLPVSTYSASAPEVGEIRTVRLRVAQSRPAHDRHSERAEPRGDVLGDAV